MNKFLLLALSTLTLAVTSMSVGASSLVANPQGEQGAQVIQTTFVIVKDRYYNNQYQIVYDSDTGQYYYYVPGQGYFPYNGNPPSYEVPQPDNGIILNFGFGGFHGEHHHDHEGEHHHEGGHHH